MKISENEVKTLKDPMLWLLAAASFLVLFQIYLIAPLIPSLAKDLNTSDYTMGLAIPAYTIPYGLSTLFYGPFSDRIGRKKMLLALFALMSLLTLLLAFASSSTLFLLLRIALGFVTGGIVPVSIALIGDTYPYQMRGKPIGLLYAAMAGGMAFGSTFGAYLNPIIGWRYEFLITGSICTLLFGLAAINHRLLTSTFIKQSVGIRKIWDTSIKLISSGQGRVLYPFIFLNGVFHSGIFSWLGYYFIERYGLNDQAIGLALLGYGIPGMLLGVSIGKAADRLGRNKLIPVGLLVGGISVLTLCFYVPLWLAAVAVALLSLGYDMTQPLFAGMVTEIGRNENRGQAVGLSACMLFLGYGAGAFIFQSLLPLGLSAALGVFVLLELVLFGLNRKLFTK